MERSKAKWRIFATLDRIPYTGIVQQFSIGTSGLDIALIRQCIGMLTDSAPITFRHGQHRVPNLCLYCHRIFGSADIRKHKSRCESNPRNGRERWSSSRNSYKRLTPRDLRAIIAIYEQLNEGPQGAD